MAFVTAPSRSPVMRALRELEKAEKKAARKAKPEPVTNARPPAKKAAKKGTR